MSDERIAPKEMRGALRDAVKKVLGNKGSAVIGDDLAAALRDAGFNVYPKGLVERQWRHVDAITGDWQFDDGPAGRCNGHTRGHEACGYVDVVPVGGDS